MLFSPVYKVLHHSDLPGLYDYRCRYSVASSGCTVSVFDQREAEDLCDGDPDCHAFVMSDQTTWTGAMGKMLLLSRFISRINGIYQKV